jgi:hypothetical protein
MEETSVIGIDLAKSVFQLEALSPDGAVVWKKRLRRAAFMRFMEKQAPRCLVGAASGGGLRPVLTAAARAAFRSSGRDGETVL